MVVNQMRVVGLTFTKNLKILDENITCMSFGSLNY